MLKKILVTGTDGFIGRCLTSEIHREDPEVEIVTYDKRNGDDILDLENLTRKIAGVDLVYHLAALSHVDFSWDLPDLYYDVNGKGAVNVMIACQKNKIPLVHISTSEVYGTNPNPGKPMPETTRLMPNYPYSEAKALSDFAAQNRIAIGQKIVIVRPFNQYGSGSFQTVEKYIPKLVRLAMSGEPLTVYGKGDAKRDWVFVEDTAEGLWEIGKAFYEGRLESGAYNIANNISHSAAQIAEMVADEIKKVTGKRPEVKYLPGTERPNEVKEHRGDNTKLLSAIGWKPHTTLEEGIRKSILFYSSSKPNFPTWAPIDFYKDLKEKIKERGC